MIFDVMKGEKNYQWADVEVKSNEALWCQRVNGKVKRKDTKLGGRNGGKLQTSVHGRTDFVMAVWGGKQFQI